MDPFKKSLGINFGSLFSAPNRGKESKDNKGEKSGPELAVYRTPKNTPKPDISVIGGFEVEDWYWVSYSNPLQPGGYWAPQLGWPVVKDAPIPPVPPKTIVVDPNPNPTPQTDLQEEPKKPCIEERTETEERKSEGIRVMRTYKRPCGSDTWDCRETWMNTSGKSKGTGFMDKGKSNIIKVQSCFDPGAWDNQYPPTEEEKALVRKAAEEIFNNKCLDNIPGLRDCLKKQWKETSLGFNDPYCKERERGYKLGTAGHTRPKWYFTTENISGMWLCRKYMTYKGEIDYTAFKAALLHEMLHLCVGLRNLQEFDVYIIANMCDPNAFGKTDADYWPKICASQNPPWGFEARERGFGTFQDPISKRFFWASDKFLWDPVTGEVFLKEKDIFNMYGYKLGKKMPIIWKCPG